MGLLGQPLDDNRSTGASHIDAEVAVPISRPAPPDAANVEAADPAKGIYAGDDVTWAACSPSRIQSLSRLALSWLSKAIR
jgi:hypothetical protein|tara:strand:+ start:8230 stop:8469 length:240 start_codon:yes stop_codon:yes gene_type:complete